MFKRFPAPFWILFTGGLLYLALLPRYDIGAYNDDAVYVIAAKSLLSGHYDSIQIPNQPVATFPSPGLPLLLAPFIHLVQPHWSLLEFLSVSVTVISGVFFWYLLRIWFSTGPSTLLLAVFAFNPTTAHFSGIVMSEPYYLCFSLASFLWLNLLIKDENNYACAFGICLGWTSLMRPEGAVLIPSVALALVYASRWKVLRNSMIPAVTIVAYLQIRNWTVSHNVSAEYARDLTACLLHWSQHRADFFSHAGQLLGELFSQNLLAFPWEAPLFETVIKVIGSGLGLGLITAGVLRGARSSFSSSRGLLLALVSFCYLYFLVHSFWSPIEPRYLLPLLPFVLILMALGFQNLIIHRLSKTLCLVTLGSALLVTYSYQNGYALYESILNTPAENLTPAYTYSWLRGRTSSKDVLLSPVAPGIFLYTERQAISLLTAPDEEAFRFQLLQNHIHLILDRPINAIAISFSHQDSIDPNVEWTKIRRWLELYPEVFSLVYRNLAEQTSIYQLNTDPDFVTAYTAYAAAIEHFKRGERGQGLQLIEESIRLDPGMACSLNAYAVTALMGSGDLAMAEKRLHRAVEIRPLYPMALLNLSRLYKRENRLSLSRKYFQESIDASRAINSYDDFYPILLTCANSGEVDSGQPSLLD